MRKTERFNQMLLQYEALPHSSSNKSEFFFKMMGKARSFSDWTAVYQYAGNSIRKDAQRKMEETVLKETNRKAIQMNIHELFMICDKADMDKILERYLRKYKEKDDYLFAICEADWGYSDLMPDWIEKVQNEFGVISLSQELAARHEATREMMKKSKFKP